MSSWVEAGMHVHPQSSADVRWPRTLDSSYGSLVSWLCMSGMLACLLLIYPYTHP